VELCGTMCAELRAGRSPVETLSLAAAEEPLSSLMASALLAVRMGGDVAETLRVSAAAPGAGALRRIAACWSVAGDSGAGLAMALDRLASALRGEELVRREIAAQVASPRGTARMLAGLPVVALLLAAGTGAHPLHVLLRTPVGGVCLTLGVAFSLGGLLWSDRLVRAAERHV
jgi:tight adherence protein B